VTSLLAEIDGLDDRANSKIVIIATTNRPEQIDPALRRPGRFDRELFVGPPNKTGREEIFRIHTKEWNHISEELISELAECTPGLVGSDIKGVCTEALLAAIREKIPKMTNQYTHQYRSEESASKFKEIIVERKFFMDAIESHKSAKGRALEFAHIPVSTRVKKAFDPLVKKLLKRNDIATFINISKSKHSEKLFSAGLFSARLLLHGSKHKNSVLRMMLAEMDGVEVKTLDFPENIAKGYEILKERQVVDFFRSLKSQMPSVLIITTIDRWMEESSMRLKHLLETFLTDLSSDQGVVCILATSNSPWKASNCFTRKWSRKIFSFFSASEIVIKDEVV